MKKICLLLLLFPLFTFAQETSTSNDTLLKGIILVDSEHSVPDEFDQMTGVAAYVCDLPSSQEKLYNSLSSYLGYPISKDLILCIKQAVVDFYQRNGRPVIAVTVPKQNVTNGVLEVLVTESTLGCLTSEGNCWFSADRIEGYVRLCPGHVINSKTLNVDLFWMNRNPFRRTDAVFVPGADPNTTNIELVTVDRFPLRLYGGIDNTGNDITGNNRVFGGFIWGDAFFVDQQLTYQFTASPHLGQLKSHTVHWSIPLPWRDTLTFFGGYSSADSKFDTEETSVSPSKFRTHGWSAQASMRYDIPLRPYIPIFLSEFSWGIDWKRTNNNLEFAEVPIVGDLVNIFQIMAAFNGGYENSYLTTSLEVQAFVSPGKWLADQTKEDYRSIRPFSSSTYMYFRSASSLILRMWYDFAWHNYFRWQASTENLLPSEQYGLGGYDTVRGFKERAFNVDNAVLWNTEFRTPATKVIGLWTCHVQDEFQLLAFFDLGYGTKNEVNIGERKSDLLYSVGPGVRYNIIPYVTFRADWGFQLDKSPIPGPHQRIHFSLIAGY